MSGLEETRPLLRSTVQSDNEARDRNWVSAKSRMRFSCVAILFTEMFERTAFYGIVGNLVLFLNLKPYLWEAHNAANALFIFTGISYMMAVFGGWVADALLGHFNAIIMFFMIYMGGYTFLPFLANYNGNATEAPQWCRSDRCTNTSAETTGNFIAPGQECCAWAVFLALSIIGFGTSGVRANIAPFGAEQVKQSGPTATRTFFNWFYWSTNVGSFLALGLIAYIQQDFSFFFGYIGSAGCLFLAFIIFLIGCPVYNILKPSGSPLTNTAKVISEALRLKCRNKNKHKTIKRPNIDLSAASDEHHGFLDNAKVRYGGSYHDSLVNDVKALLKVTCVLLTFIPYWILYMQAHKIGLDYDRLLGNNDKTTSDDDDDCLKVSTQSSTFGLSTSGHQPHIDFALKKQGMDTYRKLIVSAYLLAVHGQPLQSFRTIVRIQKANGVQLIDRCDSAMKAREFILFIANAIRNKLSNILSSVTAFSVLSDGSVARKTGSEKELVMVQTSIQGSPVCYMVDLQNIDDY